MSASSDYFDDDSEFEKALAEVPLPGEDVDTARTSVDTADDDDDMYSMPPSTQPGLKRRRTPDTDEGEEDEEARISNHTVLRSVDHDTSRAAYLSSNTYGASRFGNFGEYMQRKRQKLQIQNAEIDEERIESHQSSPRLFKDLQIYINGWTDPSVQELRQLIVKHGGVYHAYLDKKGLVTHILTCSLTPAKIREFKHMKVATPDWLVKSAEAGVLLPWQNFRFKPAEKAEEAQGKTAAQQSLFDTFLTQQSSKPSFPVEPGSTSRFARLAVDVPQTQPPQATAGPSTPRSRTASTMKRDAPSLPRSDGTDATIAGTNTPRKSPTTPSKPVTTPARSYHSTDPTTPEQAVRIPDYAVNESNVAAQRAMADPSWRAAHTSIAPDFIEGYYRNSRLHHLSMWKAELRNLVVEAQERAESGANHSPMSSETDSSDAVSKIVQENMDGKNWAGQNPDGDDVSMRGARLVKGEKGKGKGEGEDVADPEARVIMHCDFDSFFVSAGLVDRPHLRGKPAVVCHSQGNQGGQSSTSEIASASYEAREFGIKGGMSLQQARKLCPDVLTIPYEFQKYKQISLQFYTILMAHADDLQAVSVDEALIDVTSSVRRIKTEISLSQDESPADNDGDAAKQFAEAIRAQVKIATGCEVSIGIAHNVMLARLASRRAKPAGSFHLRPCDVQTIMDTLDIDDLHGFGYAAHQKAQEKLGATSLRELAKKSKAILCEALGKGSGETLYKAIKGIDERRLESDKPRRSVSCDINYGIRFEDNEQAEAFLYQLSEEVSRRLDDISMAGRSLTLKVMKRHPAAPVEAAKFMGHGLCESFAKQAPLIAPGGRATRDSKIIGEFAWRLLKAFNFDPKELRGVGIQVQKLEKFGPGAGDREQATLPFKPITSTHNAKSRMDEPVDIAEDHDVNYDPVDSAIRKTVSSDAAPAHLDLPSFSQVDQAVFEALPADVRSELEEEYKRRSVTPALGDHLQVGVERRARSLSVSHEAAAVAKRKILVKGTSNMNVKHITRQLAPKSRAGLSPTKTTLFNKKEPVIASSVTNSVKLRVTDEDLRQLDISPEVFYALPQDLQREQLALARHTHAPGKGAVSYVERKALKPRKHTRIRGTPGIVIPPPPPPVAKFPEPPSLKQRGKAKGEMLRFTETDDVQAVVARWFDAFREKRPNEKDVQFFETWLVKSVDGSISTDGGVEKAVKVMKWWLVLLRREFGEPQDLADLSVTGPGSQPSELSVPQAWWRAFRGVKAKMDIVARKKFGGCLSLR